MADEAESGDTTEPLPDETPSSDHAGATDSQPTREKTETKRAIPVDTCLFCNHRSDSMAR